MKVVRSVLFIGLGRMGCPMATHLAKAGFGVIGCDVNRAARQSASDMGLAVVERPSEASESDAVITMLPNGRVVRESLLGAAGALNGRHRPSLVIDMSSSAPTDTVSLGAELADREVDLVDAPVSGGRAKAVDGSLTIMIGGRERATARARPLLEAMGEKLFACGDIGAGHAMKALNNYVSGAGAIATMEATILGRDFGLDPETLVDVLNVSTGRNNTTDAKMKQFVLSRSWASGFGLPLMAKDIGIAADLAASRNVRLALLPEVAALWAAAAERLGDDADHTEMYRYLEEGTE